MTSIKGIILAGGLGTRLRPLTKVINKHLLPIGDKPMIYYPLQKLIESGIKDIMIVIGVEHCGTLMALLGSGEEYGCSITYRIQDKPDGIAGALRLCEGFVGESPCLVILGDNIFKEDLRPHIEFFESNGKECMLFFKKVDDPFRYGIGEFDNGRIVGVEEKPQNPKTDLACV
jgi:glucose-1-phosphate thymidylyltransferase